jgi:hypothetical protein
MHSHACSRQGPHQHAPCARRPQVSSKDWARRKGLGKFLLMLGEMLAKKSGLDGMMLTVQRSNPGAMQFYQVRRRDSPRR